LLRLENTVESSGVAGCGEGEGESIECEEDGVGATTEESRAEVNGRSVLLVVEHPVLFLSQFMAMQQLAPVEPGRNSGRVRGRKRVPKGYSHFDSFLLDE
jgi:hypothetical protein